MALNNQSNDDPLLAVARRAKRYRVSGVSIALLGLVSAGVVYWLGSRSPDFSNDPRMMGFYRSEQRQMGTLYGKQGQFIEDLDQSLKQPGTQAVLIVAAAVVIAAGCFYFARILEEEAKQAAAGSTQPD